MGVGNADEVPPPPPDFRTGGDDSARIVRSLSDAVQVWNAGHELADEYDVRAEYEQDAERAARLRRAAVMLRGL